MRLSAAAVARARIYSSSMLDTARTARNSNGNDAMNSKHNDTRDKALYCYSLVRVPIHHNEKQEELRIPYGDSAIPYGDGASHYPSRRQAPVDGSTVSGTPQNNPIFHNSNDEGKYSHSF